MSNLWIISIAQKRYIIKKFELHISNFTVAYSLPQHGAIKWKVVEFLAQHVRRALV